MKVDWYSIRSDAEGDTAWRMRESIDDSMADIVWTNVWDGVWRSIGAEVHRGVWWSVFIAGHPDCMR